MMRALLLPQAICEGALLLEHMMPTIPRLLLGICACWLAGARTTGSSSSSFCFRGRPEEVGPRRWAL